MKRVGYLLSQIVDLDNLYLAFWKAQKGKSYKKGVEDFRFNMDSNLLKIQEEISLGCPNIGNYHQFVIYEPKKRIISAVPFYERVIHHAIINICDPYFERFQIYDSYACRKEKGTYAALARAVSFQKKYKWFLKLDVKKYFDSISHEILFAKIQHIFKDPVLLDGYEAIIKSYNSIYGYGIPIGNLTSQYFANHYLAFADHFIKEHLGIKAYVRYMDDMVLWSDNKEWLLKRGKELSFFLNTELCLEIHPFCLNYCAKGLPFLGYLLYPDCIKLLKHSRVRYIRKIKRYLKSYDNEIWTQKELQMHVEPMIAFTNFSNSYGFRNKVRENVSGQWPWAYDG